MAVTLQTTETPETQSEPTTWTAPPRADGVAVTGPPASQPGAAAATSGPATTATATGAVAGATQARQEGQASATSATGNRPPQLATAVLAAKIRPPATGVLEDRAFDLIKEDLHAELRPSTPTEQMAVGAMTSDQLNLARLQAMREQLMGDDTPAVNGGAPHLPQEMAHDLPLLRAAVVALQAKRAPRLSPEVARRAVELAIRVKAVVAATKAEAESGRPVQNADVIAAESAVSPGESTLERLREALSGDWQAPPVDVETMLHYLNCAVECARCGGENAAANGGKPLNQAMIAAANHKRLKRTRELGRIEACLSQVTRRIAAARDKLAKGSRRKPVTWFKV